MTNITISDKLLKVYTNKNNAIFRSGADQAYSHIEQKGQFGILYDDFNANPEILKSWKKDYPEMVVYSVAKRGKTIPMDSKISFHRNMSTSEYTPESYLSIDEVTDKDAIYFVKKNGSTGGRGVIACNYDDLQNADIRDCVIQKSMSNPDLYNNKRYKIRQLVIIHNNSVYIHKDSWASHSSEDFNTEVDKMREKNVIYQTSKTPFMLTTNLENFDLIFENIKKAVCDFAVFYKKEIENIIENEFVILGFDFVVDTYKNVHIIEINHRSNYAHPEHVSCVCDVGCIRDLIIMLVNKTINDTKLIKCN